jgi:nitrogen fixation NifU-like protein
METPVLTFFCMDGPTQIPCSVGYINRETIAAASLIIVRNIQLDRQEAIEVLLDHFESPRHRHTLDDYDVTMPGGNPGCGDVVMVYLKAGEDGKPVVDVSWEGEGCTISQAAASILMELAHDEDWTMQDILDTDYSDMMDLLGREVVQTRTRCATLALGTLKAAVRRYQSEQRLAQAGAMSDDVVDEGDSTLEEYGLVVGDAALKPRDPTS